MATTAPKTTTPPSTPITQVAFVDHVTFVDDRGQEAYGDRATVGIKVGFCPACESITLTNGIFAIQYGSRKLFVPMSNVRYWK